MTLTTIEIPAPGIYDDIPHEDYLRWPAASASRLSDIKRSPAYCRWRIENHQPPTTAMVLGTAIHMAILEPERFEKTYALRPPGDARTKIVKIAKARLEAEGKTVLSPADWEMVRGMAESVSRHEIGTGFVRATGNKIEVSCTWNAVAESGFEVTCKIRPDILDPEIKVIVDIKSCIHAHPASFPKVIYDMGYHRAAALYLDGIRELGIDCEHYLFLAIEKTPPYEVALYDLEQSAIEAGRDDYRRQLDLYGRCLTKNEWPGYSTDPIRVGLPGWAYTRIRNQED